MQNQTDRCPICDSASLERYHDKVWSRDQGVVFHCIHCDMMFLGNQMDKGEEAYFYQNYGAHLVARGVQASDNPVELYEKMLPVARARFDYISQYFKQSGTVLEVGASAGSFLGVLMEHEFSSKNLEAVEPSDGHRAYMQETLGINAFQDISQLAKGVTYDIVCMFHVFEHIANPRLFLNDLKPFLKENSVLIIEVPSSTDPLLMLYKLEEFKDFYFQPMHPYVYSPKSAEYVLSKNNFVIEKIIPYQRYGLDNHLGWLASKKPGDSSRYSKIIDESMNDSYKRALEKAGYGDTMFVITKLTRT